MSGVRRALIVVSFVAFALMTVGMLFSIIHRWPASFGGPDDAGSIEIAFMIEGTALSPPLWLYLLFGLSIAWLPHTGAKVLWATATLIVLNLIIIAGGVWQLIEVPSPSVPTAIVITGAVTGIVLCSVMVFVASLSLALRRRDGHRG